MMDQNGEYIIVKAKAQGVQVIGLTRGQDTKFVGPGNPSSTASNGKRPLFQSRAVVLASECKRVKEIALASGLLTRLAKNPRSR